ncbi:unnamed protein product [Linum tenue]|uniref:Prolamin-like domain-containing protein n=1 Tax=Linum tenue TaxID=586396 RepID=A0AAV0QFC7_9ROSI|nr:unnamed protein product [Linum tenue]
MSPKSSPSSACFLTLFLVLTGSAAIGRSERLQPEVAAGCWKEIYQIPNCLFSIIDAFISIGGSVEVGVGVPCCAAFLSLTGDCQVEIFQNSSVITLIEVFCEAIVGSAPPVDGGDLPWPEPEPPVAPAPENGGGDMPWPDPEPAVAPAPENAGGDMPWPEPEPAVAPAPENGCGDMPWPEPEPEPPVSAPAPEDLGSTFPWPTARLV